MEEWAQLESLTTDLASGRELDADSAATAAKALASPTVEPSAKRRFLLALATKGETAGEVAAIAAAFRDLALDPGLGSAAAGAIDIVGTGGDHSGTFNLSSASACVVASLGVPVVKHGNRSITSRSGSADFLAALGIPVSPDVSELPDLLNRHNFVFLFAPRYHPAFKEIIPVRKALAAEGRRTIFNLLGPLLNPARPGFEIMGVYADEWTRPLASALGRLGLRGGFVVHGTLADGKPVDELTTAGANHAVGFG